MRQSTGTGTDFFSPLIVFGTDVLVLVLVLIQFSGTDSVLVLIAQVLSRSVPVPLLNKMHIKSVIVLKGRPGRGRRCAPPPHFEIGDLFF